MRQRLLCLFTAGAILAACDDGGPAGPASGDFDISITSGTQPTYAWDAGPAFSVSVVRTSAPTTIVWGIAHPTGTIATPVQHGSVPAGTIESAATEKTLSAGVEYRVSITLPDGKTAWQEFQP